MICRSAGAWFENSEAYPFTVVQRHIDCLALKTLLYDAQSSRNYDWMLLVEASRLCCRWY